MVDPLFAGVDLGTSRVKVGLYDMAGHQHALHTVAHSAALGPDGSALQDAEGWWDAVSSAMRAVSVEGAGGRVAAVAICGQGPSLVATDARFRPIGPAITWMDRSAQPEADQLAERLRRPVDASRHVAKAVRLSRLVPDSEVRWYLQAWDYVAARCADVAATSSAWDEDEIAASGLPRRRFPPYVPAGRQLGSLTAEVAAATGLPAGIPVVAGTNDSIASCIGSGATSRGRSVILGGTSGGFVLCWDPVPGAWVPPPDTYPEPAGQRYLGATLASSGLVVDWLARLCGVATYDGWLEQAAGVPAGAEGLVLLPSLAGLYLPYAWDRGAPINDPEARGVLFGIGTRHGTAHLVRAALEGVAYAVRQVYEITLAQGATTVETWSVGGQARSEVWNRIKADVLGVPVVVPEVLEAGALGAACLAAAGGGHYPSMWGAAAAMVHAARRIEPDPANHARYTTLYTQVYTALYPRLADLFRLV